MSTETAVLLTAADALAELRAVVTDVGPDYIYEGSVSEGGRAGRCVYADESGPSCLVGVVLARRGLLTEEVVLVNTAAFDLHEFVPEVTERAAQVLYAAQNVQDQHLPWRDALAAAQQRAEALGYELGTEL